MSWQETCVMEQRIQFVFDVLDGTYSMTGRTAVRSQCLLSRVRITRKYRFRYELLLDNIFA